MAGGARGRMTAGLVVVSVVLLLAVSGLAGLLVVRLTDRDPQVAIDAAAPASVPGTTQELDQRTDPRPTVDPARGRPLRIEVPSLGIDAQVVAVGLEDDVLVPPSDPTLVGWWRDGAVAGVARGTTLLAGHTYSAGDGVFDDLGLLEQGDRFTVTTTRGRIPYRVEAVRGYTKDQLAEVAERLFSQTVVGQTVLTTCTDYRAGGYHANIVVVAHPTRQQLTDP